VSLTNRILTVIIINSYTVMINSESEVVDGMICLRNDDVAVVLPRFCTIYLHFLKMILINRHKTFNKT